MWGLRSRGNVFIYLDQGRIMRVAMRPIHHVPRIENGDTDAGVNSGGEAFLTFLLQRGQIDAATLQRVAEAGRQTGQRIDIVLTELGIAAADAVISALAEFSGLRVLDRTELPTEALEIDLEPDFLRRNRVLPLSVSDAELVVGVDNPFDTGVLAAISYYTDRPIRPCLVRHGDLEEAFDRLYGTGAVGSIADPEDAVLVADDDIQRLRDAASEAPIIRLVQRLLAAAVEQGASDVHIEPQPHMLAVRYRLDGVLTEMERLSLSVLAGVSTRIKILAKLNIAERRLPQDGRIKLTSGGRQIDVRVSFMPTQHGESIVLRLLDQDRIELSFDALGLDGHARRIFERLIAEPNGILLVTGPTGSGKTTTLYAALKILNSVERKIFSVEDPIEYQLPGINQIQVKPQIGLDFADCLRSILRQDPDVIMLGEIRDLETARTAIQASLTGHLVLSTLHTNSAASAITRLLDMGVEDYLLSSSLTGVVAQRLVRRLCQACARPLRRHDELFRHLSGETLDALDLSGAKEAAGCAECRHTGFRGRTAITEALLVDDAVRHKIGLRSGDRELEEVARSAGMETLLQSGLRKVAAGETTVDDVLRVARF
jgi:general secretion pathway protein E